MTREGVDWRLVPDYVTVISHGVIVGYVSKEDLEAPAPGPLSGGMYRPKTSNRMAVYSRSLKVVGYMYPGVGFVPLGTAPANPVSPTTCSGCG